MPRAPRDTTAFVVRPDEPIRRAIKLIDGNSCGIAVVTDSRRRVIGTVTDGDVRRAMLSDVGLDAKVQTILDAKANSRAALPITAEEGTSPAALVETMQRHAIHQIPLTDVEGRLVDVVAIDDLLPDVPLGVQAVVMAGGFGTRLRPLTEDVPKPMLPLGDRPIMEWIVSRLHDAGIRDVSVTTHYKAEQIRKHFGDGAAFGVKVGYVNETEPLGTAGALALLPAQEAPLLVVNGDVVTSVDFRAMVRFHEEQKAAITMAVRRFEFKVPYGVVKTQDGHVTELTEKPSLGFFVNAGVYLLEPSVVRRIPRDARMDMTDLISQLLVEGERVSSFPLREYWMDVGQPEEYRQAQDDIAAGRIPR